MPVPAQLLLRRVPNSRPHCLTGAHAGLSRNCSDADVSADAELMAFMEEFQQVRRWPDLVWCPATRAFLPVDSLPPRGLTTPATLATHCGPACRQDGLGRLTDPAGEDRKPTLLPPPASMNKAALCEFLTETIFTGSALHAARNFCQVRCCARFRS